MSLNRIRDDHRRFRDIVRGSIKQDFKKYISSDDIVVNQNGQSVKIPIPRISIPQFTYGSNAGGVGTGDAQIGDPVNPKPEKGDGDKAGNDAGQHILEAEVELDELADILGEELGLPKIELKGKDKITLNKTKFDSVRRVGPDGLRHFKRTYQAALLRSISSGTYDQNNPIVLPVKEDKRFKSYRDKPLPEYNAAIFFIMDVSSSMGDDQKKLVRQISFWINVWLTRNYGKLEKVFLIHDSESKEVDENTFFHTTQSGGTVISSAYVLCNKIIEQRYPFSSWNNYIFQFTDGDNAPNDDATALDLLKTKLIPQCNQFAYGQVDSRPSSWAGPFIEILNNNFIDNNKVVTAIIENKEFILPAIQRFLSKGN